MWMCHYRQRAAESRFSLLFSSRFYLSEKTGIVQQLCDIRRHHAIHSLTLHRIDTSGTWSPLATKGKKKVTKRNGRVCRHIIADETEKNFLRVALLYTSRVRLKQCINHANPILSLPLALWSCSRAWCDAKNKQTHALPLFPLFSLPRQYAPSLFPSRKT